jgi:hypothetical protein
VGNSQKKARNLNQQRTSDHHKASKPSKRRTFTEALNTVNAFEKKQLVRVYKQRAELYRKNFKIK